MTIRSMDERANSAFPNSRSLPRQSSSNNFMRKELNPQATASNPYGTQIDSIILDDRVPRQTFQEQNSLLHKADLSASIVDFDDADLNDRDNSPRFGLNQLANANRQRQEDAATLQSQ